MAKLRRSVKVRYFDAIDNKEYEPLMQNLLDSHLSVAGLKQITAPVDILNKEETYFTLNEIIGKIYNEYLCNFKEPLIFDESTIRKKLKEYIQLELIICKKQGKQVLYSRNKMFDYSSFYDAISFFSEIPFSAGDRAGVEHATPKILPTSTARDLSAYKSDCK